MPTEGRSPLRIAILGTRGIPASYGGFETFAQELAVRLAARGHQVTVYGRPHHVDRALDGREFRGVRIRVLSTIRRKYLDTIVHAALSCADCVRRRYDVVLMCNAANSPFCLVPRLFATPVAINVDGIEYRRRKWSRVGRAYYHLGEWCAVRIADALVADADVIAAYYRSRYRAEPVVIPYGGDIALADGEEALARWGLVRDGYVLYVSRLEPENNADVVIRAFRMLPTEKRLVIVGDAPYADAYKRRLHDLAAGDERVVFTGFQFGTAYAQLLANAACYVQATEVGGTHPALLEAMSAGCVVANGTPENLEVIGDTGLDYAVNDAASLRARLEAILADAAMRADYGRRAAARIARHYTWDSVTTRYEGLFRTLVR